MVKREQRVVNKGIYLAAFAITALIFSLGLLLGMTIENERQKELNENLTAYRDDLETMYVQSLLVGAGMISCESYPPILSKSYLDLDTLGTTLNKYQNEGRFSDPEYDQLKKRYTILSIRTWIYLRSIKDYCPKDYVTILYFYSAKNCDDCTPQGVVLDDLKKIYKIKMLIFSIDAGYNNPAIKSLTNLYNITGTPTLIIDDEVVTGMKNKTELKQILCNHLQEFC